MINSNEQERIFGQLWRLKFLVCLKKSWAINWLPQLPTISSQITLITSLGDIVLNCLWQDWVYNSLLASSFNFVTSRSLQREGKFSPVHTDQWPILRLIQTAAANCEFFLLIRIFSILPQTAASYTCVFRRRLRFPQLTAAVWMSL